MLSEATYDKETLMRPFARSGLVVACGLLLLAGCSSAVDVPEVVGMPAADAIAALEDAGLEPAYPAGAPDESQIRHWIVTAQDPDEGRADPKEPVRLWVTTPMKEAIRACDVSVDDTDGGTSVVLGTEGETDVWGSPLVTVTDIFCILDELHVPTSVVARMEGTRALDGRQEAEWDGVEASWTYHPDAGFDLILVLAD